MKDDRRHIISDEPGRLTNRLDSAPRPTENAESAAAGGPTSTSQPTLADSGTIPTETTAANVVAASESTEQPGTRLEAGPETIVTATEITASVDLTKAISVYDQLYQRLRALAERVRNG